MIGGKLDTNYWSDSISIINLKGNLLVGANALISSTFTD